MKLIFLYLALTFSFISSVAQVSVSGTVVDKEINEPIAGASVIVM